MKCPDTCGTSASTVHSQLSWCISIPPTQEPKFATLRKEPNHLHWTPFMMCTIMDMSERICWQREGLSSRGPSSSWGIIPGCGLLPFAGPPLGDDDSCAIFKGQFPSGSGSERVSRYWLSCCTVLSLGVSPVMTVANISETMYPIRSKSMDNRDGKRYGHRRGGGIFGCHGGHVSVVVGLDGVMVVVVWVIVVVAVVVLGLGGGAFPSSVVVWMFDGRSVVVVSTGQGGHHDVVVW